MSENAKRENSKVNMKDILLLIEGILIAFVLQLVYDTIREEPLYQNLLPTQYWRSILSVITAILAIVGLHYLMKISKQRETVKPKNNKPQGQTPMSNDEEWERAYYQELSEDRRHFYNMLWEIPTVVFLVNSFLLGLVSTTRFSLCVERVIIIFALVFTIIFTWELFKAVRRVYNRIEELVRIEKQKGFLRYGKEESRWLKAPLGCFMVMLLMGLIIFLVCLLINPNLLHMNMVS
jgi:Mn2+/Fe2+ NRAMP family transporter